MGDTEFPTLKVLAGQFPPASVGDWRALAAKGLGGAAVESLTCKTRDDIEVSPLYQAGDDIPLPPGRAPGASWSIVQRIDNPDAEQAISQARTDIDFRADTLALCMAGSPAAGPFGIPDDDAFLPVLVKACAESRTGMRIEPHGAAVDVANKIAGWAEEAQKTNIRFGIDPFGILAAGEQTDDGPGKPYLNDMGARLAYIVGKLRQRGFTGPLLEADGRVYHDAGATDGQELGLVAANAIALVRMLAEAGIDVQAAAHAIGFTLAVDCDQFATIAKVRALRLVWARCLELFNLMPAPIAIHAETSRRMFTTADAHNNLARATIAAFAAGAGGANSICVLPYTVRAELANADARRMAINTHHLLVEEAHCARITDPALGSGLIEALTGGLASAAWRELQQIEREGGLGESLISGNVQKRITESASQLSGDIANGLQTIVGVNAFVAADQQTDPMPKDKLEKAIPLNQDALILRPIDVEVKFPDRDAS